MAMTPTMTPNEYTVKLAEEAKDLDAAQAAFDAAEKEAPGLERLRAKDRLFKAQRAATLLKARQHETGPDYPPRNASGHRPA